jgi:hypothetical protein
MSAGNAGTRNELQSLLKNVNDFDNDLLETREEVVFKNGAVY